MKYYECECCGNKIRLKEPVFVPDGICGIYCSEKCYMKKVKDRKRMIVRKLTRYVLDGNYISMSELKED